MPICAQVTPGGQRTMRTCLSASKELASVAQLPSSWLDGFAWLHCEGYCLYRPDFLREAMRSARKLRAQVNNGNAKPWHGGSMEARLVRPQSLSSVCRG